MAVPLIRTSERGDFKIPLGRPRGYGPRRTPEEREAARRATNQRAKLRQLYGITAEEFNERYDAQEGRCGICKRPFDRQPCVDHEHATGKVRGLLCIPCNVGLGWFENNEEAMIEWLSH